jgi:hypothetical protein
MNIKYNYHLHKYGYVITSLSQVLPHLYQNGVFNMGIQLYNSLAEKVKVNRT